MLLSALVVSSVCLIVESWRYFSGRFFVMRFGRTIRRAIKRVIKLRNKNMIVTGMSAVANTTYEEYKKG